MRAVRWIILAGMVAFVALTVFAFTSCVGFVDQAVSSTGNKETIAFMSLGGTSTLTGANGAHFTHDHQQSFRDGVTTLGTYGAAKVAGQTTQNAANNVTTQQAQQQASTLAIQQDAEAADAAKAAAAAKLTQQNAARASGVPALSTPAAP